MGVRRKLAAVLIVLLASLAICPAALAAGETYALEILDAEVTVPEGDFYILTRDMDAADPTLANVGMTAVQVSELLETNNIYLDALYYDASYEIAIQLLTGEEYESVFNYSLLSQIQRDASITQTKLELEKNRYTVEQLSWYDGMEASYLTIEYDLPDGGGWAYQYQTVYNGKCVVVSASSIYLDKPTDAIRNQVKAMADSLHITRTDPVPEEVRALFAGEDAGTEAGSGNSFAGIINQTLLIGVIVLIAAAAFFCLAARRKKQKAAANAATAPMEDRKEKEDEYRQ